MPSQLLSGLETPVLSRPVGECRIYERKPCSLPTTCQPASVLEMREMRWSATITDISLGGVRLVLTRRFERGTGLAIELPGSDERESNIVFVKVVHLRRADEGNWALGCKFISELSEDELMGLLGSTSHVLSSSRMVFPESDSEESDPTARTIEIRMPTPAAPEVILSDVHLQIETQDGATVFCLIKRLNASRCWPLTPGKVLSLNGKAKDHTPWLLRIQITHCEASLESRRIQGRVVDVTADDVRQMLGHG